MKLRAFLNDATFNASILGFIRILDYGNIPYKIINNDGEESITGNGIEVDSSIFNDNKFIEAWFNLFIYTYKDSLTFNTMVLKNYDILKNSNLDDSDVIVDLIKNKVLHDIEDIINKASYTTAYEMINNDGDKFDFNSELGKINKYKSIKNPTNDIMKERVSCIINFVEHMKPHSELFLIKNFTYSILDTFFKRFAWADKNTQGVNKLPPKNVYRDKFIKPLLDYVTNFDETIDTDYECCQCSAKLNTNEKQELLWLKGRNVSFESKSSYYWNCNPDTITCPFCTLIYTCMPIGFNFYSGESIFINYNQNISELKNVNIPDTIITDLRGESLSYYSVLRQIIHQNTIKQAKYEIKDIQVLRTLQEPYMLNGSTIKQSFISKNILERLIKCEPYLNRILKIPPYKINSSKTKYNIYVEVLNHIFSGFNLYDIIMRHLRFLTSSSKGYIPTYYTSDSVENDILALINIQKIIYKGVSDMEITEKELKQPTGFGWGRYVMKEIKDKNKILSATYKLTSALRVNDAKRFMDIVVKLYCSIEKSIPKGICDILYDNDKFYNYGYSFVVGLNSTDFTAETTDVKTTNK